MCGFVGWINFDKEKPVDPGILAAMNRSLSHRGPDDEGYFISGNIGIAHRRLSIIDTSVNGRQPIFNEDKSVLVVLNGEIYNYRTLKKTLSEDGHFFATQTDTEVLVHAYEKWGSDFLNHLDGMFSLALLDLKNRSLILAKDPFGKKPLYYTFQNGMFLFASELKAFFHHPDFKKSIDLSALSKYLAYEYVPTPNTMLKHCVKLPAASYLRIDIRKIDSSSLPVRYWEWTYEPKHKLSEREACDRFDELFAEAVNKRLMSDVPLGVFLSGGIDSSTVVSYLPGIAEGKPVQTFSIGFSERSFDESRYASLVADHFETKHHQEVLYPDTMIEILPGIIEKIDEPLADPSIIPTFLLCRFARQHVTVALGGDGGDELFAGYDPFAVLKLSTAFDKLPAFLMTKIKSAAKWIPVSDTNMSLNFRTKHFLKAFLPCSKGKPELKNNLWLGAFTPEMIEELLSKNAEVPLDSPSLYSATFGYAESNRAGNLLDRVIDNYIHLYLHDDILVKIDRAGMLNSLEVRSPFLDKSLSDFVNRLPIEMKMKGFKRKYLLKNIASSRLPKAIVHRPKKGFGIPISEWLNGPLKPMLLDTVASINGFFNHGVIDKLVADQLNGIEDNRKEIWAILVFELWRKANLL